MWQMLQQDEPEDFVIATGETNSVREFVDAAFAEVGITLDWQGSGVEETGTDRETGGVLVRVDPRYFRPTKARSKLGWEPRVKFAELVGMMVQADLQEQGREAYLREGGYEVKRYFE